MPTYQYACTACGEQLEAVQAFTDAPLTECPACQGRLRKVFSAVGVVFKGSGFYKTDSRATAKSGSSTSSESSGSSDSSGGGSSSGASDTSATPSGGSSSGTSTTSTTTPAAKTA